jgi:hypothetical protein
MVKHEVRVEECLVENLEENQYAIVSQSHNVFFIIQPILNSVIHQ